MAGEIGGSQRHEGSECRRLGFAESDLTSFVLFDLQRAIIEIVTRYVHKVDGVLHFDNDSLNLLYIGSLC
jgi:hypothetical protein